MNSKIYYNVNKMYVKGYLGDSELNYYNISLNKGKLLYQTIGRFLISNGYVNSRDQLSELKNEMDDFEKVIELLKKIIELGFLDYLDFRYQLFYDKTPLLLNFKITGENLYIYLSIEDLENQKMLEVSTINGFKVKDILKKFHDLGFTDDQITVLLHYRDILTVTGFGSNKYEIYLPSEELYIDFNDPTSKINLDIFYKKPLEKDAFNSLTLAERNIEDVSNSFDTNMKLLKILYGISRSPEDLSMFNDIIKKNYDVIGYKKCGDINIDWMYISSFFLMNKAEKNDLPDYVYSQFDKIIKTMDNDGPVIVFLDDNNVEQSYGYNVDETSFGANSYLFTDGKYDIKTLFITIRDALAHSSYEVIDDDYVRIFYYDSTNIMTTNFIIKKDIILDFMHRLSDYRSFGNIFPVCAFEHSYLRQEKISSLSQLYFYLRDIVVFDADVKSYKDLDELIKQKLDYYLDETKKLNKEIDENYIDEIITKYTYMVYDYSAFFSDMRIMMEETIFSLDEYRDFFRGLEQFADFEYKGRKLTEEQIKKIMDKIELIKDSYFEQNPHNQYEIITEFVRSELNPNMNMTSIINDLLSIEDKSNGNIMDMLNEPSSKYVNYDKVVKATIIAYLNNVFLYNYMKKKDLSGLDFSKLRADVDIGELIEDKEKRKQDLRNESSNINRKISRINRRSNIRVRDIDSWIKDRKDMFDNLCAKQEKTKEDDELILEIRSYFSDLLKYRMNKIAEKEINNNYKVFNSLDGEIEELNAGVLQSSYILEHIRNSLAHGNIRFDDTLDINNIGDLKITFIDYYPKTTKESFRGTIKLRDLLETLNKEETIKTIFGKKNERTLK